jgi:sodium transport system permease protein
VKLAFGPAAAAGFGARHDARRLAVVFRKELLRRAARPPHAADGAAELGGHRPAGAGAAVDAGGRWRRAEAREVVVRGHGARAHAAQLHRAPDLRCTPRRPTYEQQLGDSKLGDPVLVVRPDFEADLAAGLAPEWSWCRAAAPTSAPSGSAGRGVAPAARLQPGAGHLRLAVRGVAPAALEAVRWRSATWPTPRARRSSPGMVPFFVLMAVLYGALNAALDTTAGERERGSLEPLLMNPLAACRAGAGQVGRGGSVGMLIAVLSA